jgi:hypothetical protein
MAERVESIILDGLTADPASPETGEVWCNATEGVVKIRRTGINKVIDDIKDNFTAAIAPTVTDDSTKDYEAGSKWIDTVAAKAYMCIDPTASAAVWRELSPTDLGEHACVRARRTTTYALTSSYADITLDTTDVENDATVVEHDGAATDRVHLKQAGLHRISFHAHVGAPSSADANAQIDAHMRVNDTSVIAGSEAGGMVFSDSSIPGDDHEETVARTFLYEASAADYITLRMQRTFLGGSGSIDVAVGLTVEVMRLTGPRGPAGPPGGGTIVVQEEGTTVGGGPHDALDFVGATVTASDAGAGKALITVSAVQGPGAASDNAIARYNGATGKLIQNSGVTINDSSRMGGAKTFSFDTEFDDGPTGPTEEIDWRDGQKQSVTLDSATVTFSWTNDPDGPCNVLLKLRQDSSGNRTAVWPANVLWPGGTAPTLSSAPNAVDIVTFYYDGTDYYGVAALGFS